MADKKLRILHCANFSDKKFAAGYYATDRKISNGLIRNGHMVEDFSYRDVARYEAPLKIKRLGIGRMQERLLEMAQNIQPDLLLLGHSELVANETLETYRTAFPNSKMAMWWVDWLDGLLANRDFFQTRIDLVDDFFLTTDPTALKDFLTLQKPLERIHFMPNICDAGIDTGNAYAAEKHRHDVLFIGRATGLRTELINFLNTLPDTINLGLYGQSKDNLVRGHEYIKLLSSCRMAINYSRYNDISMYSSDRQVHLAANGCLTFTPDTPNMRKLFNENEMVYFNSFTELGDKIGYYLAKPDEARAIAEAGQKRTRTDYECAVVTAKMLAEMDAF